MQDEKAATGKCVFVLDEDVQGVLEFMQANIPASKLVAVAQAVSAMAPLLWGHHAPEPVSTVRLIGHPLSAACATPRAATVCAPVAPCVDGDSVAEGCELRQ